MTERVKDFENNRFWIAAEPLKGLKRINGLLGFDLVEGRRGRGKVASTILALTATP
jgi:hypothetical protein